MTELLLKHGGRFLVFILLQVLLIDNIGFPQMISPQIYVAFILFLPVKSQPWVVLISAFLIGITVDIFHYSPGMHASACVLAAFLRTLLLGFIKPEGEVLESDEPHLQLLGFNTYMIYVLIIVSAHSLFLFQVQVFSFDGILNTLTRTFFSSLITAAVVLIMELLIFYKKEV